MNKKSPFAPCANHLEKYRWRTISRQGESARPAAARTGDFREITAPLDAAHAMRQASRCVQCVNPHCVQGCPLHNRIPEWLALTAEGYFLEAAAVSQSTSNMPEICSRICPQEKLCEEACVLSLRSNPVTIGAIEKFINEQAFAQSAVSTARAASNGMGAAIVGSGPAGLACADQLAALGYAVTVFEAQKEPGGLLMHGIPGFKLEKSVVRRRLEVLRRRGVRFCAGAMIGRDISLGALQREFDAVFLGFGAQKPKEAGIPGTTLNGALQALPFLINAPFLGGEWKGKRVVVLGGGDTAIDCLRTAMRLGAAEALCLYRRDEANMPGSRRDYHYAIEEGCGFQFLVNPLAIEGCEKGRVRSVSCVRMELGERDASGRRKPSSVPGTEFCVSCDYLIVAYGFDPVPAPLPIHDPPIKVNEWGGIVIDERGMTSVSGVFAGGDAVRGPSLAVQAVADGRRAADGIHRFLSAEDGCRSVRPVLKCG